MSLLEQEQFRTVPPQRQAEIQVANHASEISHPVESVSATVERHNLAMTDTQRRIAKVQESIIKRAKEWAKRHGPWLEDPVEELNTGALRPLMPGERPFILKPSHIIKAKDGQRVISSRLYGHTNLSELLEF